MESVESRREQLRESGFLIVASSGNSMRPLLWGGEHTVVVAPIEGEPEVGELLLFRHKHADGREVNVVHRLVEIRPHGGERLYITRGDNCLAIETVRREAIIGRVVEVHRLTGYSLRHVIRARKFTVTDPSYLRYARLWARIWPLRRVYYIMRAHANGLRVRLKRLIKQ